MNVLITLIPNIQKLMEKLFYKMGGKCYIQLMAILGKKKKKGMECRNNMLSSVGSNPGQRKYVYMFSSVDSNLDRRNIYNMLSLVDSSLGLKKFKCYFKWMAIVTRRTMYNILSSVDKNLRRSMDVILNRQQLWKEEIGIRCYL